MGNTGSPTKGANACEARLPGTDLTDTRPPAGRVKVEVAEARDAAPRLSRYSSLRPFRLGAALFGPNAGTAPKSRLSCALKGARPAAAMARRATARLREVMIYWHE